MAIHIRDIEKELFRYLFYNKVATSLQISRDIWRDSISHQALYKRLNLLIKGKYIEANYHKELGGRLVYSLHSHALNGLGLVQSKLLRQQLKSANVLHDLTLNDIRHHLTRLDGVRKYYTENSLRSGIELLDEESLLAFKKFNFDAIMKVQRQNEFVYLPIEFERSLKFDSRYRQYFKKLYSETQIKAILFVAQTKKILEHVQCLERKSKQNCWPKTFYLLVDELLNSPNSVSFVNLNQERFTFKRLQGLSSLQPQALS
jgi:hypothetical protein